MEFDVEKEESGKLKAVNVTAPGGGSLKPPPRDRRRRSGRKGKGSGESGDEAVVSGDEGAKKSGGGRNGGKKKETKPREPPFHSVIEVDVKEQITAKGLELGQKMTIDVANGDARVKLGQGGYAGMALESGLVAEGTYTCDEKGTVTFTWERCLEYKDGEWSPGDTEKLIKTMSLVSGTFATYASVCFELFRVLSCSLCGFPFNILVANFRWDWTRWGRRNRRESVGSGQGRAWRSL